MSSSIFFLRLETAFYEVWHFEAQVALDFAETSASGAMGYHVYIDVLPKAGQQKKQSLFVHRP